MVPPGPGGRARPAVAALVEKPQQPPRRLGDGELRTGDRRLHLGNEPRHVGATEEVPLEAVVDHALVTERRAAWSTRSGGDPGGYRFVRLIFLPSGCLSASPAPP